LQRPAAPAPGQPLAESPLYITGLNRTMVTSEDIYKLHSKKAYVTGNHYDGYLHPWDGQLARYGDLNIPLGYFMYSFSLIPSWLFMIAISFVSRRIM
jgi:hypothetical protein